MSGSGLQGRWMPSSVTEEDVQKLRDASYLTGEISHRLPAQGQAIPTPQPGESVVFTSHFLRGLGFLTDPFMRGLMFYYGLEFHDLAPESILHISSFIVVCEAFLRITPHFGLWLKTFKVEIVYPYSGILINTGVGNPNRASWYISSIKGESQTVTGRALGIQPLYNETKVCPLLSISIESAPRLEFQHPKLQF